MAKFWERLMMDEEEMLSWTEIQQKLWSPVLESKDTPACSFLPQSSWVHLIILGKHFSFILLFFDLLQGQSKKQVHSLSVIWCFPLPEAQGGALSRAQAVSSSKGQRQEKHPGAGAGGHPMCLGVVVWLGLLKPGCAGCSSVCNSRCWNSGGKNVCQFTELSWSNKDADMLMVCYQQCSGKPGVHFFELPK